MELDFFHFLFLFSYKHVFIQAPCWEQEYPKFKCKNKQDAPPMYNRETGFFHQSQPQSPILKSANQDCEKA